ncbi:MAG: SBBP repeat-containing protein, partial [Bryobacteraceae bacterium]
MGKPDSSWLLRSLGVILLAILVVSGGGISADGPGRREAPRPIGQASAHAAEFPVLFYPGNTPKKRDGVIVARGKGLRARFGPTSVVFDGQQGQVKLEFIGTASAAMPGGEESRGCLNILHGADPSGWRVGMPLYSGVAYRNIYPGIDLKYHDTAGRLESDYVVAPRANPSTIRFRYSQPSKIRIENGALTVSRHRDLIIEAPPSAFQMKNGKRTEVKAEFHAFADGSVGFDVGAYDKSVPLIIDPVVTFSTFWGGSLDDGLTGVAVGSDGSIYVSGWTESSDVPAASAVQAHLASPTDAFVMKLSPSNAIMYATYLGGTGDDRANGIAVDGSGYAYVTGYTRSYDFPVVTPFRGYLAGTQNAFVAKLSPSGTALAYSTYLGGGGSDMANAIQVDASGSAYVAGQTTSTNFPVVNAYQSTNQGIQDAFVTKLNPGGNTLAYSTYIGGKGTDAALGLAVWNGQAYITGSTDSFNFPHLNAFQAWNQGGQDAFVVALNSAGNGLIYSTYLGGSGGIPSQAEIGYGIAVDAAGSAY